MTFDNSAAIFSLDVSVNRSVDHQTVIKFETDQKAQLFLPRKWRNKRGNVICGKIN